MNDFPLFVKFEQNTSMQKSMTSLLKRTTHTVISTRAFEMSKMSRIIKHISILCYTKNILHGST